MRRAAVALILLCGLAAAGWAGWRVLDRSMDTPGGNALPVRIQVQPGMRLRAILTDLQQRGVLRHVRLVQLNLRLHRQRPRAQAGIYEIAPRASARQILEQLVQGRVLLESVTIVEGWDFAQMRQALDAQPDIVHQLRGLPEPQVMQTLGHPGESAEGRFFPDTYLLLRAHPIASSWSSPIGACRACSRSIGRSGMRICRWPVRTRRLPWHRSSRRKARGRMSGPRSPPCF